MRAVREALDGRVAIAMDETAEEAGAVSSGAADAVCLKVARCGGISGALEAARAARAAGSDVYLASTFDGPAGIAAALHVAAALGVHARVRPGHAGAVRGLRGPVPGGWRRDRGADRAGTGGGVSRLPGPERRAAPQRSVARSARTRRTAARLPAAERRPATASRTRAS